METPSRFSESGWLRLGRSFVPEGSRPAIGLVGRRKSTEIGFFALPVTSGQALAATEPGDSREPHVAANKCSPLRSEGVVHHQALPTRLQAVLAPLVNRERLRWFQRIAGFRLDVLWHQSSHQSLPQAPALLCPHARRVGLMTFVLPLKVAGTHPLSLVLQAPGSFANGALPPKFADAVRLIRLLAHDLALTATSRMATVDCPDGCPPPSAARPHSGSNHPLVAQMLDYVQQNCHRPIRLDDVAAALGRSPCYLCDLFSKTVGRTFHHYLDDLRLARAKELLADPRPSICEVAYAVGYTDANYFRQAFKAHTGCPPTDWRRNHRTDDGRQVTRALSGHEPRQHQQPSLTRQKKPRVNHQKKSRLPTAMGRPSS